MAVATAVTFVWLGMVIAISFVEAPLKFRAPEVTLRIGLGIGRLVFRALNSIEVVLVAVLVVALAVGSPPRRVAVAAALVIVVLALQLVVVRPRLTRRSTQILAGVDLPRSRGHHAFVALEVVKVIGLAVTGGLLLAAV